MGNQRKTTRLARLSPLQVEELEKVERKTIAEFRGQLDDLEKALGMLRVGHHVGWRVLVISHSKRTIRKYERILGITFREFFPERGPSSDRSMGLMIAERLSNFWKAVSGEAKVPNRALIEKDPIKGS